VVAAFGRDEKALMAARLIETALDLR
jgi:hypothetical protein